MAKIVDNNHLIGAKGVNAFEKYCLNHSPVLIWREETKNDYGIDGEVEFTFITPDNKTAVSGRIIKIQLKSTESKGYIGKENDTEFEFLGKQKDVEYWVEHQCDVILVVYFVDEDQLFAKKIEKNDLNKSRKSQPILFSKENNKLESADNRFYDKYSSHLKSRVDLNHEEKLFSNLYKFHKLPKQIYKYKSRFTVARDIFDSMEDFSIPPFVLKSDNIYVFANLAKMPTFCERVIVNIDDRETEVLQYFITDINNRRIITQLINSYVRKSCYNKWIRYNRQFKRFYFTLSKDEDKRVEQYKSKKGRMTSRTVAQKQSYFGVDHIRHLAFQIDYVYSEEQLYIAINPKYLFTSNGHDVLEDRKLVAKLTNYQTSNELNQSVINQIYFCFKFLASNGQIWSISSYTGENIEVYQSKTFKVPFGIRSDFKGDPDQLQLL